MRRWAAGVTAVALAAGVPALGAQPTAEAAGARPVAPPAAAAVGRLAPGAYVRAAAGPVDVSGFVRAAGRDTLVLRTAFQREVRVPVAALEALWVAEGRQTSRGAGIGALVGGAGLGAVGLLAGAGLCDGDSGCATSVAVHGVGVGVLGGVVLGALVGRQVPRWERAFP